MRRGASIVVVAAAVLAALLPIPATAIERWYSSAAYPAIQRTMTPLSNAVPWALLDALGLSGAVAVALLVYRRVAASGWTRGVASAARALVVAAAGVYLAFLALWGLNYRRVPLVEKLAFDPARVNGAAAGGLGDENAARLNRLYRAAHPAALSLDSLASSFEDAVRALGGPVPVVPGRPKQTLLGAYFHQTAVSGMTDPFFLETLVAPDLLEVERPFVVAHEWAHLAGYADESEANFVAWLACRHGDSLAQYSAALALIGYVPPRRALREALDLGPRLDLWAIQRRYAQTSRVLRAGARRGYDTYLKANRVAEGIESYDAVVRLIVGTTADDRGYPRRR